MQHIASYFNDNGPEGVSGCSQVTANGPTLWRKRTIDNQLKPKPDIFA